MLLGLEIPADVPLSNDNEPPVRASRRIAQLRIMKEAEKSREDEAHDDKKHKKDKSGKHDKHDKHADGSEKKKRKKKNEESEEDAAMMKVYIYIFVSLLSRPFF